MDERASLTLDYAKYMATLSLGTLAGLFALTNTDLIIDVKSIIGSVICILMALFSSLIVALDVISSLYDKKRILLDNSMLMVRIGSGAYALGITWLVVMIAVT